MPRSRLFPLFLFASLSAHAAEPPSGEAVYQKRCSRCHDQTSPRIPPRAALQQMPAERILRALDFGAMMTVAYPLHRDERQAVAAYLGTAGPAISYPPSAFCADRKVTLSDHSKSAWNGWSPSAANARYQPADAAGLDLDHVRRLR